MTNKTPTRRVVATPAAISAPYGDALAEARAEMNAMMGPRELSSRFMESMRQMFSGKRGSAIPAGVRVGKVVLPLHGTDRKPVSASDRLGHHLAMQQMAGVNWQGQPRGFRIAPTSRKNPNFHKTDPVTRVEQLARQASLA